MRGRTLTEDTKSLFAPRCLSIDLEVGKTDERIHQFAGIRGDTDASVTYNAGSLNGGYPGWTILRTASG